MPRLLSLGSEVAVLSCSFQTLLPIRKTLSPYETWRHVPQPGIEPAVELAALSTGPPGFPRPVFLLPQRVAWEPAWAHVPPWLHGAPHQDQLSAFPHGSHRSQLDGDIPALPSPLQPCRLPVLVFQILSGSHPMRTGRASTVDSGVHLGAPGAWTTCPQRGAPASLLPLHPARPPPPA